MMIYFLFLSRFGHACHLDHLNGDNFLQITGKAAISTAEGAQDASFRDKRGQIKSDGYDNVVVKYGSIFFEASVSR